MKKRGLDVPPWRINGYMQSKWFGSYRRTTNTVSKSPSTAKDSYGVGDLAGKRLVGFEALPMVGQLENCGGEILRKVGLHVGNLKVVFNGMD